MDSSDSADANRRPEPLSAGSGSDSPLAQVSVRTRAPQERAQRRKLGRWWPVVLALTALIAIAVPAVWSGSSATAWGAPAILPTGVPSRQFFPIVAKQPTPTPLPTSAALRSSDFGLVWVNSAEEPHDGQRIQRGADTGARLDRFPVYWNLIETSPGNFTWDKQDQALAANESHGLGTLAILLGLPGAYYPAGVQSSSVEPLPPVGGSIYRYLGRASQLSAQGTCTSGGPPAPSGLDNPIFVDGTDIPGTPSSAKPINSGNPWARFIDQIVNRYRPGGVKGLHVSQWEVWNEPDLCGFWTGTSAQYARLLKVAYLVIKQRDPQATVVMGGLAHYEQPGFLGEVLDTLKSDPLSDRYNGFFDAIGAHHYAILWNGYSWTNDVRQALAARGWAAKQIWVTESGVAICNDYPGPNCPSPWRGTPQEQASYIWENIAYTRLAGGGPIFQFNLFDDCGNVVAPNSPDGFGLVKNQASSYCSPENGTPRLSYTAFTLASRYLAGTDLQWSDVQPNAWTTPRARRFAFYDPTTKERRTMVFALDSATTVTLPAIASQARRLSLDGSETILTPTNGQYQISLPGPTNHDSPVNGGDCSTTDNCDAGIYGVPYLIIERDTQSPSTSMTELPATSVAGASATSTVSIPVSWTASDQGSGLERIDLYYSKDEGPWQLWWSGAPEGDQINARGTQQFSGEVGHSYRFAVMALDRAGNAPGTPVAQAETRTEG